MSQKRFGLWASVYFLVVVGNATEYSASLSFLIPDLLRDNFGIFSHVIVLEVCGS